LSSDLSAGIKELLICTMKVTELKIIRLTFSQQRSEAKGLNEVSNGDERR